MNPMNRAKRILWTFALSVFALLLGEARRADAELLSPDDAQGIRRLGAGAPILLQPGFLSVQFDPGFLEDRTVAVFDVSGLAGPVGFATLGLDLQNLDPGGPIGVIDVFAFPGTSPVTADQFFAGAFLSSLQADTSGLFEVDVTGALAAALAASEPFLSFRLSTTTEDRFVSGPVVGRANPTLNVEAALIPEPSTLALFGSGVVLSCFVLARWPARKDSGRG